MSAVALLLALLGFAALTLAMSRHYQGLARRVPTRRVVLALRGVGWVLLAGSLAFSLAWLGHPVGFVAWFGLLNIGALGTAFGLTLARSRASRPQRKGPGSR